MKKLEISNTFKKLSKFGKMLALAGTISTSAICFSGCSLDDVVETFQGKKDEKDTAALEEKGQILQLLRLSSGKSCAWKVGYFSLDEEDLHFIDAFENDDTNLSYLLTISDGMKISYCDYANICNTDILLSYKITKEQSDDILSNLKDNTATSITPKSEYSCKEEVTLKSIKDSSYEDIVKNTNIKNMSLEKAPQKKKK